MKKEKDNLPAINQVRDLVANATESNFYGKLTFQFQNGKIVIIRKEETLEVEKGLDK